MAEVPYITEVESLPGLFDPARYITKVKGQDYLEVKWRLVWLRDRYPAAQVETDLVSHVGNQAIFRAKVTLTDSDGVIYGSATGWGSEEVTGFANYIEKAETKSIGRALAALGFGTQFCGDHDYGEGNESNVVDAPVSRDQPRQNFNRSAPTQMANDGPSPKQAGFIQAVSREMRMNAQGLNEFTQRLVGKDADQLSRRDASTVIEALKEQQNGRGTR